MPWMRVENAQDWTEYLEKRPCGCYRYTESSLSHWWKYNRFRYWWRCLKCWTRFILVHAHWRGIRKLADLCEWFVPIHFMLGLMDMSEAHEAERNMERVRGVADRQLKKALFLGADSDHPDGIYATRGHSLVCMTNDEAEHW